MSSRVALVTGANKGIGLSIVKILARSDKALTVILTARSDERGKAAVKFLDLPNVQYHQLDVNDDKSVAKIKDFVDKEYSGLDILVQNHGIAWKGDAFDGNVAEQTVGCNFFGAVRVWESLRPLVRAKKGRVVNVSSRAGNLGKIQKASLRDQFVKEGVTADDIKRLMHKFVEDVKAGTWKEEGWPRTTYGVSKVGLTAITKVWAKEEEPHGVAVYSCCPGWVRTDMGGQGASKTPDEGADTPVYLATTSNKLHCGGFYGERHEYAFDEGPWKTVD